ncbi:MucBP domain-containing protein [Enterococcus quebecensis]|uniref:Gram-positive cocci surface proteins LPxTG domain-containing protein n=1 Tax=Enterococcus quebecensis TaxID=903983 RepID=A0A1E5H3R3_9ENTE|nr:MucBP domain-containing protein [Enterococcus quebecensis]OEG19290.1 hypothetical protein BCR23_00960 [Enterococcus quebecensis]
MKKWTHTLLVSTMVLGTVPYSAINSSISAEAVGIEKSATAEKQEKITVHSEVAESNREMGVEQVAENQSDSEQALLEPAAPEEEILDQSPEVLESPSEKTENSNRITPRNIGDFTITVNGVILPTQEENYQYTNAATIEFIRTNPKDFYSKGYQYEILSAGGVQSGNQVDMTSYLNGPEGIYMVRLQGLDGFGGFDTGYFFNNIQRTVSSVDIDGVVNEPESVVENPSSIKVGRDKNDTYGEYSFEWIITGTDINGNSVTITGSNRQPTPEEIASLEPGEYVITNTVTEELPEGYVNNTTITDTTTGKFKITGGKVIVEHILVDSSGKDVKIHTTTNQNGKIGSNYETAPIDIPGYELIKETLPDNQNGQYEKTEQTVKYYYRKIKTNINVEYVDENGNPLTTGDKILGEYEEEYSTKSKDIPGYDLVSKPTNAVGKHTDKDQTVSYVYKKKATKVNVNYVDEKGVSLADSELINGLFDDPYKTAPKEIPGYTVIIVPTNASGKHVVETTEVTYVYSKIKTNINVEYVDENGNPIATGEKVPGEYGNDYKTTPKEIPGYDLVVVPTNADGKHNDKDQTVRYEYKKKATKVTVNYVDEKGKPLADSELINGLFNDPYETKSKQIPGYILVAVPNNASGNHAVDPTDVTYVYKKIEAPLVNDVMEGAKEVSGTGMPNSKVVITFPNGEKVTVDVDKDGKWIAAVPEGLELKAGEKLPAVTLDPLTGATSDSGVGKVIPLSTKDLENNDTTSKANTKSNYSNTGATPTTKNKLPNTGESNNAEVISIGLLSLILAFFGKFFKNKYSE